MRLCYLVVHLLASIGAIASPLDSTINNVVSNIEGKEPRRAPDPPPAPTPLPPSTNGILSDKSVINFTPNNAANRQHSCWTPPNDKPPKGQQYVKGICSVCMVQRTGGAGSGHGADYQFWARDNINNPIGSIGPNTMWPIDAADHPNDNVGMEMLMGGSYLLIQAELDTLPSPTVSFVYALPPVNPNDPAIWGSDTVPHAMFDPTQSDSGNCTAAGNATNGAVRYAICFFDC